MLADRSTCAHESTEPARGAPLTAGQVQSLPCLTRADWQFLRSTHVHLPDRNGPDRADRLQRKTTGAGAERKHRMTAVIAKSPATIEDLRRVPKDGRTYELVDGAIVVTPAGMRHSGVCARITSVLATFVLPRGIGEVYTEGVGIQLPSGNVRSPDVSFVRTEKLPGGQSPVDYGRLIPDLVVEVLSPADTAREIANKLAEYLGCGVPLVWVVDPERRTVMVHRPNHDPVECGGNSVLTADPVLSGFSCRIVEFFPT